MIHRIKKLTSLVIAMSMLIVCFTFVNASAEETITMGATVHLSSNVEKNGVNMGKTFDATVSLDFDEDFIYAAGGLLVVKLGITYDPAILEPVDPSTDEVIEFGEDGRPVSGALYTYGDIASNPSRMSMMRRKDGRTIEAYYTASASTDADNIWASGNFFTLSFKVKEDITLLNSAMTAIGIADSYAGGLNKVNIEVETQNAAVTYNPPYTFNVYNSNVKLGEYLTVLGLKLIPPENSENPLVITITKDGEQIEEPIEVPVETISYHYDYLLDEAKYTAGSYLATASYNNTRIERSFVVAEKIVAPAPDDTDKEEENSGSTDGTINVTPNTGNNSSTNTGANNNTSDKKDTEDKEEADNKDTTDIEDKTDEVQKPQVKYPSDTAGHWADSNIKYVYENSLMNGYADGTFGPDNSITRAEFVTVMARLLGKTEDTVAAGKFADAYDHWAKGYIGALASEGIVGGVSENEFAPDENITREQIAVILARAFDLTKAEVEALYGDDALISDWARDGVYSVTAAGYMQGSGNNFNPTASATRAEVATIIYRLHSK